MPVSIQIFYDSPYSAYYCGQIVTGRVVLSLDKPKTARSLGINFKGEAEVSWTESESKTDRDGKSYEETTTYTGKETYYENKFFLLGTSSGQIELPPGQHTYPFQCQLPQVVPSSFEGEYGHVRYTVTVVLDRPWKFDVTAKAAFTVVAPLDLNTIADVKEPVIFEKSKYFCCFCCKSGPLTLTISLPVSGFVPGQTIPFSVEIENGSNIKVHPVNCVLRKEVTWHATSPIRKTKVTKTTLAELAVDEAVSAHDSKSFSKDITVPPVPPSNLANCGIIDLEYVFKVEAVVSGCHKNLNARIPIVLGTIPLLSGPTAFKPALGPVAPASGPVAPALGPVAPAGLPSDPASNPVAPGPVPAQVPQPGGGWHVPPAPPAVGEGLGGPAGLSPSAPLYPELPPPSYQESVFGGGSIKDSTDNEHTMGTMDFTPRYPVWNFGPSVPKDSQ